jgi:hypothetical protein
MTKLTETITLPNGLILEIIDRSRLIAADTTQVVFVAQIVVTLDESFFSGPEHYETTRKVFGPQLTYTYRKERTFVRIQDKDSVFNDLVETFKNDTMVYLSHRDFPRRFALSKLRDILSHPYKYSPPQNIETSGEET